MGSWLIHDILHCTVHGNQRTHLHSGGSGLSIDIHFVGLELSYAVLSPLPIVLSKHFNHPHPYIEITTAISDISQWWNAGMGNTDTLHPNSCFCSFSIPTSKMLENKICY